MYIIGVDGGGTKTDCALANLDGKIISISTSGPSNPRNSGIKKTGKNIAEAIEGAFSNIKTKKEISFAFIGIPALAEEYKEREEEIKKEIFKNLGKVAFLEENFIIGSDQEVAFRSGTDEKNGVVVISGTGSVARGWNEGEDVKTSGWGFLADTAGSFQIGQEVYKKTIQALDKRTEKTILTEMVLEYFDAKNINDINKKVYQENYIKILSPLSIIANKATAKGDKVAYEILSLAGRDLVLSTENTVKKLEFKEEFPLVIVGGMFKSDIFLNIFKEEVIKKFKMAKIIIPKDSPVKGAVKIALEKYA